MIEEEWFDNLLNSSDEVDTPINISSIKTVDQGISTIADLNETAVEYIEKEKYEDAGNTLLYAYEAIPLIERLHIEENKKKEK